jgi:cysteine desulfurase
MAMGHRLTVVNIDRSGQPDWEQFGEALRDPPALVACAQVNNETGAVIDMARLIQAVRRAAPGAHIHVDGVQGFMRMPFDARQIDSYALSAHKIHGPKGIGALYARPGLHLKPILFGGGQEKGLRSGTENTPGIAGLCAAVTEMSAIFDIGRSLRARKEALARALREGIPSAVIIGPAANEGAPHILNVSFPPVGGEVMLHALESAGVYVSTGAACSSRKGRVSPVLAAMGVPDDIAKCAVRFSLSPYNTFDEIFYAAGQAVAQYGVHSRYGR